MAERCARDVIDDKVTLFIIYVRHYSILFVLLRFVKWFYKHLDEKSFHQNEFKPKIFETPFCSQMLRLNDRWAQWNHRTYYN